MAAWRLTAPLIRSRPWRYINLLTYLLTYIHTYVCPSTKSFSDSNLIWCVRRGQGVIHDGMPYDPIQGQGQGHVALKVNSSVFKICLIRYFQWQLANDW